MKQALVIYLLLFIGRGLSAQEDTIQTTFLKTVPTEFIHSMTYSEDKGFLGYGWDFLQYTITSSQYVLIGEMHGTKEIPIIIKEINRHKKFDYFITEIDSMSATYLVDTSIDKYQTLHNIPGAFSMYSTKDELELIKSINARQLSVVGIDMVHPISFRFFLYQLLNEVDLSEKSRNILNKIITRQNNNIARNGVIGAKEIKRMFKKLARINKVYFNDDNPIITFLQNNLYPPDQMRNRAKHLQNRFASLESQNDLTHKCALLKFGSSHLLKTKNTAGFVDLGELVNTYSLSKNIKACFVGIFPVNGKLGLPMPIQGKKEKIFDINNSNYYRAETALFKAIKKDNQFSVINLRGLKEKYGSAIEPHSYLNELIENYDVLIFIQNTSPAELLSE